MSGKDPIKQPGFDDSKDCDSLSIRTQIASPVPKVIATLKIGDILNVVFTPPRGPVSLVTKAGATVGAVTPSDLAKLIQCINDGHVYIAKVVDISGGNVQVIIKHK